MDWKLLTLGLFIVLMASVINCQLLPNIKAASQPSTDSQPIELEILLLRFNNPHGIVYSGKKCDFFYWGCDIKASGYVDIDRPYEEWPGVRDIKGSDVFWYRGEESSPRFNQIFRKTICDPVKFQAGNLRVTMMDVDGGLRGDDDFINNFNCIVPKSSNIAESAGSAGWSSEMNCDAMYSNPLMSMNFKYRMYRSSTPAAACT